MKKILLQILILGIGATSSFSQTKEPFYEQIAFDYFRVEILTETQKSQKIKIELDNYFWATQSDKKKIIKYFLNSNNRESDLTESLDFDKYGFPLNLKKDKRFKRKRFWNGNSPKIEISVPIEFKEQKVFIIIKLINKNKGKLYYLEMDKGGKVLNYCTDSYISMTIH